MTKTNLTLAAAVSLALVAAAAPAGAATAHNLQTGAHTKNAYDPGPAGNSMGNMHMKKMKKHHSM